MVIVKGLLTANGQLDEQDDADFEGNNVKDEVAEVVRSDTVVDPGTVAFYVVSSWVNEIVRVKAQRTGHASKRNGHSGDSACCGEACATCKEHKSFPRQTSRVRRVA